MKYDIPKSIVNGDIMFYDIRKNIQTSFACTISLPHYREEKKTRFKRRYPIELQRTSWEKYNVFEKLYIIEKRNVS